MSGSTSVGRVRGEYIGACPCAAGTLRRFSLPIGRGVSYYDHVVREPDPQHDGGRGRGENQYPLVAVVRLGAGVKESCGSA